MTPFLHQVARHYFAATEVDKLCFVFPNRRSLVFFKKYLCESVAASGRPVFAPECCTMNDFVCRLCKSGVTDRVSLLTRLYDCYKPLFEKYTGRPAETLDEFVFWGDVILSDFNDVDKYLIDPSVIFTNIAQYKQMQSDFSFLSETQRSALEKFLGNFSDEAEYKTRFQTVWDLLLPLYRDFNEALGRESMNYEGRVYRHLAEMLDTESAVDMLSELFPDSGKYVFVGLNALNACERRLLVKLRDAGIAEFCWDFSSRMVRDPENKASLFLTRNVADFPQAFQLDPDGLPETEFHVLSVGSGIGQAKQIPEILRRCGRADIHTAVVLPDEKQLIPVLNSIPSEIEELNVTMGYPLEGSELWPLMKDIAAMQMHLRQKDGKWYFYHKQAWSVFSNGLLKSIMSEKAAGIVKDIRKDARYYIEESSFSGDSLLECIFTPVVKDPNSNDPSQAACLMDYQLRVLEAVAVRMKELDDMALELDFAREIYQSVRHLRREPRQMLPATLFRLEQQLMSGSTVPFKGEPLKGLQIMGPLETRALDFENLVILGCNEGTFPRRSSSSSFIPGELRKGFDLPTYEYKDAMWAYYFYRMIQRASNVWLVFDSRTEGLKAGEESRFIKQLELNYDIRTERLYQDTLIRTSAKLQEIEKTQEHIKALHRYPLSASALKNYLDCPARFYYSHIMRLKPDEEVSESLDAGMMGSVFHDAMLKIYSVGGTVTGRYIRSVLDKPDAVRDTVRELIAARLNSLELSGRNIIYCDIICSYVNQVLKRDLQLLESHKVASFSILGLEMECHKTIGGLNFIGYIDRLDSFVPDEVRVLDYKTGRVSDNDFLIDDDNAETVVADLFGTDNSKRPRIALQLYIYDLFAKDLEQSRGKRIVNTIYQTSRLFVKDAEQVSLSPRFCELMKERLDAVLAELQDPGIGFTRTSDSRTCEHCDFKQICGR